jgi:group I intron endonuclease
MFVYCLTNTANQKRYIGLTTQRLRKRITGHFLDALRPRQQSRLIVKAINKYGRDAFTWELVGTATALEELYAMEQQAIQDYNTFYRDGHGYNMTRGGEGAGGYRHTADARAAMSRQRKGKYRSPKASQRAADAQRGPKNHQYRTDVSPERRAQLDRLAFLKTLPPEEKAVVVAASIHRPRTEAEKTRLRQTTTAYLAERGHPFQGRSHTADTKTKLAAATRAHIAAHGNPRSLPVTYEGVTYPSIKAAMEATGRDRRMFRRLLRLGTGQRRYFQRPIELDGEHYASAKEAMTQTGRSSWYVYTRLRDGRARYLDEEE